MRLFRAKPGDDTRSLLLQLNKLVKGDGNCRASIWKLNFILATRRGMDPENARH